MHLRVFNCFPILTNQIINAFNRKITFNISFRSHCTNSFNIPVVNISNNSFLINVSKGKKIHNVFQKCNRGKQSNCNPRTIHQVLNVASNGLLLVTFIICVNEFLYTERVTVVCTQRHPQHCSTRYSRQRSIFKFTTVVPCCQAICDIYINNGPTSFKMIPN